MWFSFFKAKSKFVILPAHEKCSSNRKNSQIVLCSLNYYLVDFVVCGMLDGWLRERVGYFVKKIEKIWILKIVKLCKNLNFILFNIKNIPKSHTTAHFSHFSTRIDFNRNNAHMLENHFIRVINFLRYLKCFMVVLRSVIKYEVFIYLIWEIICQQTSTKDTKIIYFQNY